MKLATLLFALTCAALPITAQRILVVDQSGAGGAFTDLPPAVAAATDGDIILVRTGQYRGATVTDAIRILGVPGSGASLAQGENISMRGVSAGEELTLSALSFVEGGVDVTDCAGAVHLDRLRGNFRVTGTRCDHLSLQACGRSSFRARADAFFADSTVLLTDCDFTGEHAARLSATPASAAVQVDGCRLTVAGGLFRGGDGDPRATTPLFARGAAAFATSGQGRVSQLLVTGDASTQVIAGRTGSAASPPFAFQLAGTLDLDPQVTIVQSTLLGSGFPAGLTVTQRPIPWLQGQRGSGQITLDVVAAAGLDVGLAVSTQGPLTPTAFGTLWLNLQVSVALPPFRMPASGVQSFTFPVPAGVPPGLPLVFQAVVGPGRVQSLTTPLVIALP